MHVDGDVNVLHVTYLPVVKDAMGDEIVILLLTDADEIIVAR